MEKVYTTIENGSSIELCKGEIPGTRAMHHIITPGEKFVFVSLDTTSLQAK